MPMCEPSLKAFMEISLLRLTFDSKSFLSVQTVKSGRHHHMNLKVRFSGRALAAFDRIPFKPKPSSYSDLQMAFTSYSSQKRNERI
jgi:hypothetical protein